MAAVVRAVMVVGMQVAVQYEAWDPGVEQMQPTTHIETILFSGEGWASSGIAADSSDKSYFGQLISVSRRRLA